MKNSFKLLLGFALLLSACKSYEDEYRQVSMERDSLIYVSEMKDSSINSFLGSFNEISDNLDSITQRQASIDVAATQGTEIRTDKRARINESIRIINELLERNRKLIADLERQLRSEKSKSEELKIFIEKLNNQIKSKDQELAMLKAQLAELNLNVENLNIMIDTITAQKTAKENELKLNLDKLHTAYYITGTFKELRDKNIVNNEGGFLGIGKNKMVKPDFNSDAFNRIDITQTTNILFESKTARLLTVHPTGSYNFQRDKNKITGIVINDFEKFWGASKYLVILKD